MGEKWRAELVSYSCEPVFIYPSNCLSVCPSICRPVVYLSIVFIIVLPTCKQLELSSARGNHIRRREQLI